MTGMCNRQDEDNRSAEKPEARARGCPESEMALILDSTSELIVYCDAQLRIKWVNKAVLDLVDGGLDDLVDRHCYRKLLNREEPCDRCPLVAAMASGKPEEGEVNGPRGSTFLVKGYPVTDKYGELMGLIEFAQDVTARKRLEDQLLQAHKMEAIGTLAGGIAHEFNNILAAIFGYTELAMLDEPRSTSTPTYLQQVLNAGRRAQELVSQILAFSREQKQDRRALNIKPIVKELLKLLRSTLPANIEIHGNIDENLDAIIADPTEIHQLLMNLCTNAAYAMRHSGGVLAIGIEQQRLGADFTAAYPGTVSGQYLHFSVGDTGSGIQDDIRERIFDPFFSSKGKGEGTGMGLSVVHGIVKDYGGVITVDSRPGKGTVFDIYLPVSEKKTDVKTGAAASLPKGTEAILFVDDEPTLTDIAKDILERLGYHVETRTNGLEALELFRHDPEKFDLVITDMTMPHMTGEVLAEKMISIRPDIPIIMCTGYSDLMTEEKAYASGIKGFAMKPIICENIANLVREVLDSDP